MPLYTDESKTLHFDVSRILETWKFPFRVVIVSNVLNGAKRLNGLNDLNGL